MSNKKKITIATIMLFILIGIIALLTFIKYFVPANEEHPEISINESSSNAIHIALKEITNNFNQNKDIENYNLNKKINMTAVVNNYSIYISHISDTVTTFEFNYENLCLSIMIDDTTENKEKFFLIYKYLIDAIQKRLNNEEQYDKLVDSFLKDDNVNYDGLSKEKKGDNKIEYKIDITKKINNQTNKNGGV